MTTPSVPHALVITNLTGAPVPIASGLILRGSGTTTFRPTTIQSVEQMIPKLDALVSAGRISYQYVPSEGGVSGLNLVYFGAYGALGTSTVYVRQTFAVNASDNVGWLSPGRVRLRNLQMRVNTAPGSSETVTLYVNVGGTNSVLACAIGGTDTTGSDPANEVDVLPGAIIRLQLVPSSGSSAADLSGSFEMV